MRNELSVFFDRVRPAVEKTLGDLIPAETIPPAVIHQAMRYSTLDGGKRIRPCLCIAAYSTYQDEWSRILPVASAIEMIHAYSLIHDDLPAMDDDDFRRGKPSCHKAFGEAMAILAGDALLTLAFEVLGRCQNFPPDRMLNVISRVGSASGSLDGMVAGQVLDLEAEGAVITADQLQTIHKSKTGALIGASIWTGAYLGGASELDLERIRKYCDCVGLAFQVVDDILDVDEGKDRDQQKATYPAIHGLESSRKIANQLMAQARSEIAPIGSRADLLRFFCDYLENRTA